ncbi:neuropeptide F receptor [Aethina tumida]|uniref:neuropeptide F receptor n=1 Tax=Aethina tumida TaxID=116153 RepID=UPI00096AFD8C|nr:neuropeptide F receptor [Aethina tumida]XP_049823426.1 neuropeptide F receptor [Aethina tumida]XP_049823427.1 neuropeptide F receptor [Aethina tumida]
MASVTVNCTTPAYDDRTMDDSILNQSNAVDPKLMDRYLMNRAIDEPAYSTLIVMYSVLIVLGALGNTLVIISVVRKPVMRTPRNMFIVNLAVADLLLCTVTMPLTLMEILTKYFPLGDNIFVCKMIGMLQATSTYVSTISITAIALDRYQVIVYPTKESLQLFGALLILLIIWSVAVVLALPLFVVRHISTHNVKIDSNNLSLTFCYENWPMEHGRAYYSVFSLIFQYTLPIIIVSVAYIRISYKLRYRFASGFVTANDNSQQKRRELRGRKLQRTNLLLGSIAVIFCVSWIPLNMYNVIADFSSNNDFSSQSMMVYYAVCHMMGMSSACSNPILYGCLNENFWKEFKDILCVKGKPEFGTESQTLALTKQANVSRRNKPDLVTVTTDYQPCQTATTELSMFTKC